MIKIYTLTNLYDIKNEIIILYGLSDKLEDIELNNNHENVSKLSGVIEYCKDNFIYTDDINDSDIIVLPIGFDITNKIYC